MNSHRPIRASFAALFAAVLAATGVLRAAAGELLLNASSGENYETAVLRPRASGVPEDAKIKLVATDSVRGASTEQVGLDVDEVTFENQTAARPLVLDGYVVSGGETNALTHELLFMGNLHDEGWLSEDAETFTNGTGTGTWSGRDYATVEDDLIRVNTSMMATESAALACTVSAVPTPRRGFVLASTAIFPEPYVELPDPAGQRFGLTIASLDGTRPQEQKFYYLSTNGWAAVPVATCDPCISSNWYVYVSVDCSAETATYYVRPGTNDAWTILGTADGIGSASATEMSFRGIGAIGGLEGEGFDADLIKVDVVFDTSNLHPGVNFEETIVTGFVKSAIIHSTDRLGGTFRVRLTDLEGNEIETDDYEFLSDGTVEFYVKGSDLTAGASYTAEVILNAEAEARVTDELWKTAVMGRELTNAVWGTNSQWVRENARTFDEDDPGTGDWDGRIYAVTTQGWIYVQTDLDDESIPSDAAVSFTPTNELEEAYASYVVSIKAIFAATTYDPVETEALFGFTLALTDDGERFMCLSNHVWQTVPADIILPELGVEYELSAYVQMENQRLDYLVRGPSGVQTLMMTVALESDACESVFQQLDLKGKGYVNDLSGRVYSTDLLRIHTDFTEGTLAPGTNFTASTANCTIRFEPLWETDHTNGTLRVAVRDKYGRIVSQRRISFHGLDDRTVDYTITGLTPGETYSVDVTAEVKNVDSDKSYATGSMARVVTNALWHVSDEWIRESAETVGERAVGTGRWDAGDILPTEDGEFITINTTASESSDSHVGFLATNTLPYHTGFEIRANLIFDVSRAALPEVDGLYGITIVDVDDESGESSACRFAILTNGVWMVVDGDIIVPDPETEYELTIRVDQKEQKATYYVRAASAAASTVPTVIAEYPLLENMTETAYQSDFYGLGHVRTYDGDGFDVSIVHIEAEFDEAAMTPGTNFAGTAVKGVLHIQQVWELTDRNSGSYTIGVYDAHGNLVSSQTLTYEQLTNQNFNVYFENLTAGETYDITVVADLAGDVVSTDHIVAVMAREVGGWIREDPETFLAEKPGTGLWLETNDTAYVVSRASGRAIRIDVCENDVPVRYDPTNDTPSVRCSTLREIRALVDFNDVGWSSTENPPTAPSNTLAAVTVWGDDSTSSVTDRDVALAVISTNGQWIVLDSTRRRGLLSDGTCVVTMLIDLQSGFVRYDLATANITNRVHQYDFEPTGPRKLQVSFGGNGFVSALDGDVWDPNLIAGGTNEFDTLNAAIVGAPGETLSPLWWADQYVTVGKGSFTVYDTNNWLRVTFPDWYFFEVTTNGSIRVYRFNCSNNWIDYAEDGESNIVVSAGIYFVKTPEGLSWIAAQATNEWISGRIQLERDIDLTQHNWTPIAGFSGVFDGQGHTITNLNNSYHNGRPGGEYVSGPTNAWGRSTYGLFGTATNATLANVTFAKVAISNLADSVAALAGALAGNCVVSNVTVESGSVLGLGGTAAGVAGFADFADLLRFVNNTNRAGVAAQSAVYGEGRWAAGLLCVGGSSDLASLGTLVATNNVNYGVVSNVIYDADLLGGNVAQILAGTTYGAKFGDVHLTNNVASGAIEVSFVRSGENMLEVTNYPSVNLASAFWGYDDAGTFYRYIDSNKAGVVPVDPVQRTARMLTGTFPNGTVNPVGLLNDEISALLPGSTLTLEEGLETWSTINIDRNLTFDLGGHTIYTLYVDNTFTIGEGVAAKIRNGEIIVGYGEDTNTVVQPFVGDLTNLDTNDNLTVTRVDQTFFERTTIAVNGEPLSLFYTDVIAAALNKSGTVIELYEGADVELDVDTGSLKVNGVVIAQLTECYGFSIVTDDDGTVLGFEVKILDSAAPTAEFSITGGDAGMVNVTVGNAKEGFWYALEHKSSLTEKWITPSADEWVQATASGAQISAPTDGSQGYYRVIMSDVRGGTDE